MEGKIKCIRGIDEELYHMANVRRTELKLTMGEFVNDALRHELQSNRRPISNKKK